MEARSILKLATFILTCEMAGVLGEVFAAAAIPTWYAVITKPWFTPPSWLLIPVWIILYAVMGIAGYLIWENKAHKKLMPFVKSAFCWQLSLNMCWPLFFFGLGALGKAFADIVALWIALVVSIVLFYRISKRAALILIPSLVWVTIMLAMNFYVWRVG